jgi:hypothetical protein
VYRSYLSPLKLPIDQLFHTIINDFADAIFGFNPFTGNVSTLVRIPQITNNTESLFAIGGTSDCTHVALVSSTDGQTSTYLGFFDAATRASNYTVFSQLGTSTLLGSSQ